MSETRQRKTYDPTALERRWQERWAESGLYETDEDESKPKHYALTMLPYPSGDLHVGHWYPMTPSDTRARFMRMNGYRVFFPIGFDAFGLPAENAAIQRGIQPREWTYSNIERMRVQLRQMGAMFDFDAEVVTCDPEYYRWNQWFFVKFFEKGLAYRQEAPVDWCPKDNTTLAREQVVGPDRRCERCGTPVIKKYLAQWLFKITDYAEELLDFSNIDWPERVETLQRNWIGRSEGAEIRFEVEDYGPVEVFTTRPDTLFGATFFVMSPEHPAVERITTAEQARRGARLRRTGWQNERDRPHRRDEGEDRRLYRSLRHKPGQRGKNPRLHRRLRPDGLRHRRDHGRPRPRRAGLRVRDETRHRDQDRDSAAGLGRRRARRSLTPARARWSTPTGSTAPRAPRAGSG